MSRNRSSDARSVISKTTRSANGGERRVRRVELVVGEIVCVEVDEDERALGSVRDGARDGRADRTAELAHAAELFGGVEEVVGTNERGLVGAHERLVGVDALLAEAHDRLERHPELFERVVETRRKLHASARRRHAAHGRRFGRSRAARLSELDRTVDCLAERVGFDRFQEVAERAALESLHRGFDARQAGHEQDGQVGIEAVRGSHHVESARARHREIGHDDVDFADVDVGHELARRTAVADTRHVVPRPLERATECAQQIVVVVHENDASANGDFRLRTCVRAERRKPLGCWATARHGACWLHHRPLAGPPRPATLWTVRVTRGLSNMQPRVFVGCTMCLF